MENVTPTSYGLEAKPVVSTFDRGGDVGTVSLWGFLGPAEDDLYRLYTDVSFSKFYEIPQSKIVWVEESEEDAPARVHVANDFDLSLTEPATSTTPVQFYEGSITDGYLREAFGADANPHHHHGPGAATEVCTATPQWAAAAGFAGGGGFQQGGGQLCITVFTAVPTWCDDGGGENAQQAAPRGCLEVGQTLICTIVPLPGGENCLQLFGTAACTIPRGKSAKGED